MSNGNLWAVRDHARMEGTQQRGWRVVVDGESRPTSRGRAHVELLGATARSTLVIDFGRSSVKAAVAYHDRDRIAHLHGVPAYLLQHMFGERDDYLTVDVAARVFDRVRHQAASLRSGLVPMSLWLTHRTRDDGSRMSILAKAARLAGLAEPTYMAEPLAGAACFDGLGALVGQYVAVLDFGQGSFDAALLQRTRDGHAVIADWCPADHPSRAKITERLYLLVWDKLDAVQRSQVERDYTLALAIRRRLSSEPLFWGPLGPQHRRVDLPRPLSGIDLTRGEFVGVISAEVGAVVDGLFDTTKQAGVPPTDIAEVYLASGLGSSDLVAALITQRLGRVPIGVAGGNEVALGAANAALGTATQHPLEGDRTPGRVPRLYSPRRLMPTVCLAELDDPCPEILILDRGQAASRKNGVWDAGVRLSDYPIADMYQVEDHAERFWLMDEAAAALKDV